MAQVLYHAFSHAWSDKPITKQGYDELKTKTFLEIVNGRTHYFTVDAVVEAYEGYAFSLC